jgi:hypothetical protein
VYLRFSDVNVAQGAAASDARLLVKSHLTQWLLLVKHHLTQWRLLVKSQPTQWSNLIPHNVLMKKFWKVNYPKDRQLVVHYQFTIQ